MRRDRVVLGYGKGALFDDFLPKFEEYSDTSLTGRKQEVNQVKLAAFEPQDLDSAQELAKLVQVGRQPQVFPQIFELAQKKRFEDGDDFAVQVVCVLEILFAVECGYLLHGLWLSLVLIELLFVLMQSGHKVSHELIDGFSILVVDKLVLHCLEGNFPGRFHERVILFQIDLLHASLLFILYKSRSRKYCPKGLCRQLATEGRRQYGLCSL